MNTFRLSNVSLKNMRLFLKAQGLQKSNISKGRGGHEKWERKGMLRPIILQTSQDPVPERIVKQIMRHLKLNRTEFIQLFKK